MALLGPLSVLGLGGDGGGGYFVKVNYHNFQHETSKFPAVG